MSRFHHTTCRDIHTFQGVQDRNVLSGCRERFWSGWIIIIFVIMQASICLGQENPLNPNYCEIQPFGTMDGWLTKGGNQRYGKIINPIGDVNGDSIADWIIVHNRIDTSFGLKVAQELLLYYGVRGGLPLPRSGRKIGPDEIGSATRFISSGQFDSDPYTDLVVAAEVFGDTVDGASGTSPSRVVVYWGNPQGDYSNADTSHLLNPGRQWIGFYPSVEVIDRKQQGLNDILLIWGWGTVENKIVKETAYIHLYHLPDNSRWGRNEQSRLSNWQLWNAPRVDRVNVVDHDGDGRQDLVFINDNELEDSVQISVIYGIDYEYFDTLNVETISLQKANGRVAEMIDVTGDGIPDLVVNAGSQELIKIFIGRRGHRLKEQYGTGIDPPDIPGGRPFSRPWARILLPNSVNPNWGRIGFEPLWDLGDIGNDSITDIVIAARPYMYVYSTGKYCDSYIDATLAVPNSGVNALTYAARLGDIDGSGRDVIAIRYTTPPGGIAFFHTSNCVENAGGNEVPLPPGTGRPTTSVDEQSTPAVAGVKMGLRVEIAPNPSTGKVQLHWETIGTAYVSVSDVLGNEYERWITPDKKLDLDLTGWSRGMYIIAVHTRSEIVSEKLVLQ